MKRNRLGYTFLVLCINISLLAQVSGVNYDIKYNNVTCLYDCCVIINSGFAETSNQRIQGNAQFSIVVPTGTIVGNPVGNMPLQNNANYNGTIPIIWEISSIITSPEVDSIHDFMGITPILSTSSFYNNIYSNDTIKLFSLDIWPICNEVRMFDIGIDPDSDATGMAGGDFSNGFTMSLIQLYEDNASVIDLPIPIVSVVNDNEDEMSIRHWIENVCYADTIFFETNINNLPIILTDDILIDKNIVISGNGISETILDGNNLTRIFTINSNATLILKDLTLQNTFEEINGGAIHNNGTLILQNVTFQNNFEGNKAKALTNIGHVVISSDQITIKG